MLINGFFIKHSFLSKIVFNCKKKKKEKMDSPGVI